jgi:hypothetical protein
MMKSAGGGFEKFNTNFKARVESVTRTVEL